MSNMTGEPGKQPPPHQLEEDLREFCVADAVGALSEKEQQNLEYQEAVSDPGVRKAMWDVREGVMKQLRADLPKVEPEASLKHRVLARVLRAVESDFVNSTEGRDLPSGSNTAMIKRNWLERFVGGRVSPVWRVAALVLLTISAGLFWNLTAANLLNKSMISIARDNETENFAKFVGPETLEYFLNPLVQHVPFKSIGEESDARARILYFPGEDHAFFLTKNLPILVEGEYFLRVETPSVDAIVVRFTPRGQITGIDFVVPSGVNPTTASWVITSSNTQNDEVKVMQNIS